MAGCHFCVVAGLPAGTRMPVTLAYQLAVIDLDYGRHLGEWVLDFFVVMLGCRCKLFGYMAFTDVAKTYMLANLSYSYVVKNMLILI